MNGITYWYHTALVWSHSEAKGLIVYNARTMAGRMTTLTGPSHLSPNQGRRRRAGGRESLTCGLMGNYPQCCWSQRWCSVARQQARVNPHHIRCPNVDTQTRKVVGLRQKVKKKFHELFNGSLSIIRAHCNTVLTPTARECCSHTLPCPCSIFTMAQAQPRKITSRSVNI